MSRCLIIADDLTGGADTGVQFTKRGLTTHLTSLSIDFELDPAVLERDVLVISTDSRGLSPHRAKEAVRRALQKVDPATFPIVYKKIDSTLRGNIGYEVDTVMDLAGLEAGFLAPAFPEVGRMVVGGIMLVGGTPVGLTEAAQDAVSPVNESYVHRLIERQSTFKVGWVDLVQVAAPGDRLGKAVQRELERGARILVFDAFSRRDLAQIVAAAFRMARPPLLIGSAGLAGEVAQRLAAAGPAGGDRRQGEGRREAPRHFLILSGSLSSVTRKQVDFLMRAKAVNGFELDGSVLLGDGPRRRERQEDLAARVGAALQQGHVLVSTCAEQLEAASDAPIHLRITECLGGLVRLVLEHAGLPEGEVVLFVTGGDTALGVFRMLGAVGLDIDSEVLDGIALSRLVGGGYAGLPVITKAGAFGSADALVRIMERLQEAAQPE
jgi:uncharacterized protein YgbK (DUF1537 family)